MGCVLNGNKRTVILCGAAVLSTILLLSGCRGVPTAAESEARRNASHVGDEFRPHGKRPALPPLSADASLSIFLQYAILNSPKVEAAYFDWLASVERVTQARSLPDPQLTFQADIARTVESLMPGLMFEFTGPGKLGLQADVASAESDAAYPAFESSALNAALELRKSYYQLYFLEDRIRVNREMLNVVSEVEKVSRRQNEVGKATLQDVLRAQTDEERLRTDVANLEDSREPLLAAFKAALGLKPADPPPPIPAKFETTPLDTPPDKMLAIAFARNPRLRTIEADVHRAEAMIRLAGKAGVPDFTAGIEADLKASPLMWRPQFSVTLPIRRGTIAARIAESQAAKDASEARLTAEQIVLTVELAEKTYMFHEATRQTALCQETLLPKARQSLDVARASYSSGQTDFTNLMDAWRAVLGIEIEEIEARIQRELALAELSLLIVAQSPANAPFLHPSISEKGSQTER
jgi:outer membrane protein TolC